ncbi:MAG: T9SS type A sorting domain-containing protein [Candidatus Syntrophosphaera sp.]|nr:T9SS type A sorting domain-containing protein [Candidatus Syntrophosphaera sp.]
MGKLRLLPLFVFCICVLQAFQPGETFPTETGIERPELDPGPEYHSSRRGWLLTQNTRYHYNAGWQFSYLENYGYNAQGQQDLIARHNMVDGAMNLFGARDYVYTAAGQLLGTVYYSIADGVWSGSHRESNVYETDGNLGQVFVYEGNGSEWFLNYQQANSYEQGRLASEHLYGYYSWDGTFTEYESRFYSYNSDGKLEEKLILTVIGDPQEYTQRMIYVYSYTPDGSLAETLYQFWSWINGEYAWRDDKRDIHTCDGNGFLTEILQQYNSSTQGWHDTKRYTYTNDAFGNATLVLYQINSADGWQDWYKWEKVYANTGSQDEQIPPAGPELACRPNPFSGAAEISFEARESGNIDLAVYNLKGQKVKSLAKGAFSAGTHKLAWNGKEDQGQDLAAGIYLVRLRLPDGQSAVRRVTVLDR